MPQAIARAPLTFALLALPTPLPPYGRAGETRSCFVFPPRRDRHTHNSRLSVFDSDNVRLDLAVHGPPPEPLGDRLRRDVGRFAEPRSVARIDLAP